MPTPRQLAEITNKMLDAHYKDEISKVISAVFHLLYGSYLYKSDLWPIAGLNAGYPNYDSSFDSWYVGASVKAVSNQVYRSLLINIISDDLERIKDQGKAIDLVLDLSVYDSVNIEIDPHRKQEFRYRTGGRLEPNYHTLLLAFTFTIQQQ